MLLGDRRQIHSEHDIATIVRRNEQVAIGQLQVFVGAERGDLLVCG